jgi:hypothetical protein
MGAAGFPTLFYWLQQGECYSASRSPDFAGERAGVTFLRLEQVKTVDKPQGVVGQVGLDEIAFGR